jgi:hypothetical protein
MVRAGCDRFETIRINRAAWLKADRLDLHGEWPLDDPAVPCEVSIGNWFADAC